MTHIIEAEVATCHHCGDPCKDIVVQIEDKVFCCEGCKIVYEIIQENDLCTYYQLEDKPGVSLKGKKFDDKYAFLENAEILQRLLNFSGEELCRIILFVPSIHCSSCIWLLENLHALQKGVLASRVDFIKKEVSLSYNPKEIQLRQIVELMATLGYEPDINLDNYERKTAKNSNRSIFIKIGVVGFCAGNIMALSFPEYFGLEDIMDKDLKLLINILNVVLSVPVFFYGASGYFISAYQSLKEKVINLDVPLSIGIFTLFARSLFETLAGIGPGYWDSLAGLVFFLLLGKWLQHKTFENLSFERNYKSYFPLAATVIRHEVHKTIPVADLKKDDTILIRNGELIPADSLLMTKDAWIDYSFVTGESMPVARKMGDYIYAGGRLTGSNIKLKIEKPVSQSYLTQLWNNAAFSKEKATPVTKLAANFSRYFTIITLSVALLTALFWLFYNPPTLWNAFTAVLIVACPCALSLAMPFTMENTMRIFGKRGFFFKNPDVIQQLATITHIVFDKTGTLTDVENTKTAFVGELLTNTEQEWIKSLTLNSTHPISKKIAAHFNNIRARKTDGYEEVPGAGIEATIDGHVIKMGSPGFLGIEDHSFQKDALVKSHVMIDGLYKGYFTLSTQYRRGLEEILKNLKQNFRISLLSGDKEVDLQLLTPLFDDLQNLHFNKKPEEKLEFIKQQQGKGYKVLMIGDGLNDAGALKQSDVGMVLTDDVQAFFPACDVLADARRFELLPRIIKFSRSSVNIVKLGFLLSMVYNFIAVGWAVSGNMTPVFAAIFMPLSSMSVVAFSVGMSSLYARIKKIRD